MTKRADPRSACTVLAMELQALQTRLQEAGFWETAHKVNDAIKAIGYEAEYLIGKEKCAECGRQRRHPLHVQYGNDVNNSRKHEFQRGR
jgi:hypothetical protein